MIRQLTIFSIVGFLSCQDQDKNLANTTTINLATDSLSIHSDTIDKESVISEGEPLTCKCLTKTFKRPQFSDVAFQNHDFEKQENQEKFNKWAHDTLRLKVTSIKFSRFDTIPEQFKVFENVEQIILSDVRAKGFNAQHIYGVNMFPKLKSITFWGSHILLNPADNWLKKIERLHAEKTKIQGIKDFDSMPNLREIFFAYSGFIEFPNNIHSLKCLSSLTLGAYNFGHIDLTGIDLTKLPCLKNLKLQTWHNSLTGLPLGLENNSLQTIIINHPKLTKGEKEKLKMASR